MQNSFDATTKINGPYNVVRMEGSIDGKKKIMYSFFDMHVYHSHCPDDYSLDIDKFLIREYDKAAIKDPKTKYDLYIEFPLRMEYNHVEKESDNYLEQMARTFFSKIDLQEGNDIMKIKRGNDNLRLHLVDMRQAFLGENIIDGFDMIRFASNHDYQRALYQAELFLDNTKTLMRMMQHSKKEDSEIVNVNFLNYLVKISNRDTGVSQKLQIDFVIKMLWKLYHMYNHDDVKKIIVKLMDEVYDKLNTCVKLTKRIINKLNKAINIFDETIDKKICYGNVCNYSRDIVDRVNYTNSIIKLVSHAANEYADASCVIMDLYFARRFLDKDYTTYGVFYGGGYHSADIIHILVKYFNFKVTNFSFSENENLNEVNQLIKDSPYIVTADMFTPPTFSQCSDSKGFPEYLK